MSAARDNDSGEPGGDRIPPKDHHAGFVVLAGRPNVGKSTLLNRLLGEKVAIVSRRPQTTRTRILGVYHDEGAQIAFLDTPGIHVPRSPLNKHMVSVALGAIEEVDVCLLVTDVGFTSRKTKKDRPSIHSGDVEIIRRIARTRRPAALLLNKIDAIPREKLLPIIDAYRELHDWAFIYPLSALTGEGVEGLGRSIAPLLPASPPLFPYDVLTDQAERILAAEYVREQVFNFTHAEVPYGVAIEVRQFDETERESGGEGLIRINADIIVDQDSHKGIIIGNRGSMLRRIGRAARKDLERLLGAKVWLGLHVRVEKGWTKRPRAISSFE